VMVRGGLVVTRQWPRLVLVVVLRWSNSFRKRETSINHFLKLKKLFWSNRKYFRLHQTPKNTKNIFQKFFYTETN